MCLLFQNPHLTSFCDPIVSRLRAETANRGARAREKAVMVAERRRHRHDVSAEFRVFSSSSRAIASIASEPNDAEVD